MSHWVIEGLRQMPAAVREMMAAIRDFDSDRWIRDDIHAPDPESADLLAGEDPYVLCRWDHKPWPCSEWIKADERMTDRAGVQ